MSSFGDIRLGDTIDVKFTTSQNGVPTTLAGTPVVSAYPANSLTQLTAGITLTVDFDSVTGLHNVRVVASGANGYLTATNYALVVTTGTVGGVSVVGYVIDAFSIENRSAVMPTTAARTLDVSAGGEAGLDWANIGSPTTSQTLSGTTVGTSTALTTNNDKTGYSIGTGGIAAAAFAAGALDAAAIAANAIGASEIADGAIDAATFAAGAVDAAALATDAVTEIWAKALVELAQATPSATPSVIDAITMLYMIARNAVAVTSSSKTFSNDAGTVIVKKALTDDGTSYTEAEMVSGP